MTRKKVLILGKLPPPYMGPSIATEIILKSPLKEKFELIHLDTRVNRTLDAFGKWSVRKIFRNLSLYRKMNRILRKEKPDLVLIPISQTSTGFLKDSVYIWLAHRQGCRVLLHLRGSEFKNWLSRAAVYTKKRVIRSLKKAQGVIVLGNKLRYLFADYFPPEKIFVVPNGGNYTFPSPQPHADVRILYFSNLLASKGVEDVLLAIRELRAQKAFSIDLVGEWYDLEAKKRCMQATAEMSAAVRIHASKGGADKLRFFADADIFVFPPREPEGHPWAIVEAMAAGLPIISTDKGAITESVIDGSNGFIVDAGQPAQIAARLKLLIEDERLRERMGNESRNLYLSNFTEEKMTERLEQVFHIVMNA